MKKNKFLALLLAVGLIVLCFSGCGSSSESTQKESASETTTESASVDTVEEEPAEEEQTEEETPTMDEEVKAPKNEEPDEVPADTSDGTYTKISDKVQSDILEGEYSTRTSEEYAAVYNTLMEATGDVEAQMPGLESTYTADGTEISVQGVPYEYPIEGETQTLSIWAAVTGNHQGIVTDFSDYKSYAYACECANVDVDWTSVSQMAGSDQLNLMLASGDMTDLIVSVGQFYTGNVTTLFDEELIYDISDLIEEYCPNYVAWLNTDETFNKIFRDDEGRMYGWYDMYLDSTPEGWFIRTDKLEEWGIDAPVTIADYEDCFERMINDGSKAAVQANSGTYYTILASSFDIATLDGPALCVENGSVVSSWYSDNAKLYIETMHEWYENGYIYNDIIAITTDRNDSVDSTLLYGGDYFMFADQAAHYADFFAYDLPDGWDVIGGTTPVMNAGDKTHFDAVSQQSNYIVMTTDCEDIETACLFMDWFYTDEGINTSNFGPEGVSWYWTDEGERVFTDVIWNDTEYNQVPSTAFGLYQTQGRFVSVYNPWTSYLFAGNTVPIETTSIWGTDGDSTMTLPTDYLYLTTAENDIANQYWADLTTYAVETISKMVLGQLDIDSEWDNLVNTLQSMGLDEIVAQYDAAYQRYLAR